MVDIAEKRMDGIHYLERGGEGVPLVLLHGIGSNASSFVDMIDVLPGGVRTIAWNTPGYLDSQPLDIDWPVAMDYASTLRRFLDALSIDQVHLVGHSLGTLIGAAFATTYPARVAMMVLASCANGYGVRTGAALSDKLAARITDLGTLGAEKFAQSRAQRLVFEPQNNPDIVAKVQQNMARVNPAGYAQAVRMLAAGDLASTMQHCVVPTRFIIGANDQITPESQTLAAAAAWSDRNGEQSSIEKITRAGHAVYVQKPVEFADILMKCVGK